MGCGGACLGRGSGVEAPGARPQRPRIETETELHNSSGKEYTAILQSQKAPEGEWRVVNSGSGLTLANAFSPAEVARCVLAWSAKNQSRVSLGVWSRKRTLAPGERMRLETAYELR